MIGVAIVVGIILMGFVYLCTYMSSNRLGDVDMGIFLGIVLSVFFVIEIGIVSEIFAEQIPTALDVYRGNTELMITSVNGIPTDTTVVFKN
jgi:hypothetical protein